MRNAGAPGQSMLRPEHLLASHQLPEFLEQEDRAWHSSHGLASLSSGWGREEAASWPVFPGSPLGSMPNPAQQVPQCSHRKTSTKIVILNSIMYTILHSLAASN